MADDIEVGRVDDFRAGAFTLVEIKGREYGVIRLPNGEFRTIRNACPHKAAPICAGIVGGTMLPSEPGELRFAMDGEVVVCPWHGYEFDLNDGRELFVDGPQKLRLFPTTVRDGAVYVTL